VKLSRKCNEPFLIQEGIYYENPEEVTDGLSSSWKNHNIQGVCFIEANFQLSLYLLSEQHNKGDASIRLKKIKFLDEYFQIFSFH
jgi:hypothetical protein